MSDSGSPGERSPLTALIILIILGVVAFVGMPKLLADIPIEGIRGTGSTADAVELNPKAAQRVKREAAKYQSAEKAERAKAQLEQLRINDDEFIAGYDRDAFEHWSPVNDGPCDARDQMLIRDGYNKTIESDCYVKGQWVDPYSGRILNNKKDVDVDHIVPLAAAWRKGAASWAPSLREQYANDPVVLWSVSGTLNREKSDKTAQDWQPPAKQIWCAYAIRTIQIETKYQLTITTAEKGALTSMLDTCPKGGIVTIPLSVIILAGLATLPLIVGLGGLLARWLNGD